MKFTKNLLLPLIAVLSLTLMSPAYVIAAGKIENATNEEVKQALVATIKATEDALASLHAGADGSVVNDQINEARQLVKRVENNRLDVIRTRAADSLKKARQAVTKGENKQAEESLNNALKSFKDMLSSL